MQVRGFAAVLAAASLLVAAVAGAQTSGTGTGSGAPGASPSQGSQASSGKQEMVGTIKSIDDKKLVLEDGTEFMLPPTVQINRTEVKEGTKVRISYQEQGGEKVVSEVDEAS